MCGLAKESQASNVRGRYISWLAATSVSYAYNSQPSLFPCPKAAAAANPKMASRYTTTVYKPQTDRWLVSSTATAAVRAAKSRLREADDRTNERYLITATRRLPCQPRLKNSTPPSFLHPTSVQLCYRRLPLMSVRPFVHIPRMLMSQMGSLSSSILID